MKLDLLTNATVVDDAIRFVSSESTEKGKPPLHNSTKYDEHGDQLEEEQEEEVGEITTTTTNRIF